MKALIVDPSLHAVGGHHYNAAERLTQDLSDLGISYEVLGSVHADEQTRDGLHVKPCFSLSIYSRSTWTHREFLRSVDETFNELVRYFRWRRQKPALLILPCCDQALALALARYIGQLAPKWQPHILLWLLFAPNPKASIDDAAIGNLFAEYRQAFAALKAAIGDHRKLVVHCETELMANAYRDAIDVDIAVVPGPSVVNTSHVAQRRMGNERPTVMCVGHANAPKGYDLLPGSIERVLRVRPDVAFLIHGMHGHLDAERNVTVFETLARIAPQVEVDTRILSTDEYIQLLQRADLLLLPYDPLVYRARGSGVFNEATTLGIPMVVTSACGFAQSAFDERRAIPIERYDCGGVGQAVLNALEVLPLLTERASAVSQTMRGGGATSQVLADLVTAIEEGASRRPALQRMLHRR